MPVLFTDNLKEIPLAAPCPSVCNSNTCVPYAPGVPTLGFVEYNGSTVEVEVTLLSS